MEQRIIGCIAEVEFSMQTMRALLRTVQSGSVINLSLERLIRHCEEHAAISPVSQGTIKSWFDFSIFRLLISIDVEPALS